MTDNRGLALWYAVLDAAKEWPGKRDVMGVGHADDEIVVIRVHRIDQSMFKEPPHLIG